MRVAFQGEIGAYSEEAVLALFPDAEVVPKASFEAVFEAVDRREVDAAVVPIENSLHGSVHANYDLLREHSLSITAELQLRIRHHLMGTEDLPLSEVRAVHSHPQALGQCRDFLRGRLPQADVVPAYDTAGAAKLVAERADPTQVAIASQSAAREYGLVTLAAGIESNPNNFTRFLALAGAASGVGAAAGSGAEAADPGAGAAPRPSGAAAPGPAAADPGPAAASGSGPFKTSLLYVPGHNIPGVLFKSLAVFALREIDLFKIESRPLVGSPGKYIFYLDLAGSVEDETVLKAIDHLREIAAFVKVLGSYRIGRMLG